MFNRLNREQIYALTIGGFFLFYLTANVILRSQQRKEKSFFSASSNSAQNNQQQNRLDNMKSNLDIAEFYRVQIDRGVPTWEVRAKNAKYITEEKLTYVTAPILKLHRKSKERSKEKGVAQQPINITAKSARLSLDGDKLIKAELEGDVIVASDGTTVTSNFSIYDSEKRSVFSPGEAHILGVNYETSSQSLELDIDSMTLFLQKEVNSKFEAGAKPPSFLSNK
jgi:LPS export ABC transporter protein LptC